MHPESYKVARDIASEHGVQLSGIGSDTFVREITKLDPSKLRRSVRSNVFISEACEDNSISIKIVTLEICDPWNFY